MTLNKTSLAIFDAIMAIFTLLADMGVTTLKEGKKRHPVMWAGCAAVAALYITVDCLGVLEPVAVSFLCLFLPAYLLLWALSAYKGARFVTAIFFINIIMMMLTAVPRCVGTLCGLIGQAVACVLVVALVVAVFLRGRAYIARYRELTASVPTGWQPMMLSGILLYFLSAFVLGYPAPLEQRPVYFPVFVLLLLVAVSLCYVFVSSLIEKASLYEMTVRLKEEKKWQHMAYADALTGAKNRMAYIERMDVLSRSLTPETLMAMVVMDVDSFKSINDRLGHRAGDSVLKCAAAFIQGVFCEDKYEMYRIGGDEFVVIARDVPEDALLQKLAALKGAAVDPDVGCTLSCGYAMVDPTQDHALDIAFARADKAMYTQKNAKKTQ